MPRRGEDNVDLVRRLMAAHNSGPRELLARYDEFFDPDCEWIPAIVGSLERTAYHGRDGFRRWYAERDDALEQASVEITSCTAVDEEVVLLLGRSRARGRSSGAEIDEEVGIVFRLREGLIVHDQAYDSHREAREAAHA